MSSRTAAGASANAQSGSPDNLQTRILRTVQHVQFAWFLGHIVLLSCALRYFLAVVTFSAGNHVLAYRAAFFGSLVTYAVVIYKTYVGTRTPPKLDVQLAARVWSDENVQYFLLALYWGLMARPVALALVPYVVFSTFHCLTYLKSAVLPTLDPSSASETSETQSAKIARASGAWVKSNYEKAMQLVAGVEVVLLGLRVTLGFVLRQSTFITILVFAAFLRYRYLTSAFVRQRFSAVALAVDHALADPRVPPAAKAAWKTACDTIYRTIGNRGAVGGSTTSGKAR